jgi:nucleotide-binding universal stress UspA family protein
LRATLALAEKLDAQVDYVHVIWLPIPIPAIPSEPPLLVLRESGEELRRARAEELAQSVAQLGSTRCTPSAVLGVNVPETLAEKARSFGDSLIAIPSHGRGRLREALFGTTAEHVVKISPIPVLVFPLSWLRQGVSWTDRCRGDRSRATKLLRGLFAALLPGCHRNATMTG